MCLKRYTTRYDVGSDHTRVAQHLGSFRTQSGALIELLNLRTRSCVQVRHSRWQHPIFLLDVCRYPLCRAHGAPFAEKEHRIRPRCTRPLHVPALHVACCTFEETRLATCRAAARASALAVTISFLFGSCSLAQISMRSLLASSVAQQQSAHADASRPGCSKHRRCSLRAVACCGGMQACLSVRAALVFMHICIAHVGGALAMHQDVRNSFCKNRLLMSRT